MTVYIEPRLRIKPVMDFDLEELSTAGKSANIGEVIVGFLYEMKNSQDPFVYLIARDNVRDLLKTANKYDFMSQHVRDSYQKAYYMFGGTK